MRYLCILALFLSFCVVAQPKEVILAADRWCPINCGENDPQQGFMVDVARLALRKFDYTVRYIEMPWPRAIAMARAGEIHGIVGAYKDDAPDLLFADPPLMVISGNTMFTRVESDWIFKGVESLNSVKLGIVKGYAYGDGITDYINKNLTDPTRINMLAGDSPVERNIKLLLHGRIDVVTGSPPVIWHIAKELQVSKLLREAGQAGTPKNCYIAFSPRRGDIAVVMPAFKQGVTELMRNGKIRKLAWAYGIPDSVLPQNLPTEN
jgi:polar amino acid transport system substrate-binding protein